MRRTKIEIFLAVLEALTVNGSLRVTELMRKANLCHVRLKPYLTFAVDNFVVDKRGFSYSITPVGVLLFKVLRKFWSKNKRRHLT